MKIKLAILEADRNYLKRIVGAFSTEYADRLEVYSFTDDNDIYKKLNDSRIEVFLAGDLFEIDVKKLPVRCGFAYFVNSPDIESVRNQRTICKYQKVDLIYRQILELYSEKADGIRTTGGEEGNAKFIAFQPVSGGCGASTMAAACALYLAKLGKRVLYLNLEELGSSTAFFSAEGSSDMSDLIYALKSRKGNFTLKLESCLRQDPQGVSFFAPSKEALDMLELNTDDKKQLLKELRLSRLFDYVILDQDFSLQKEALALLEAVHTVIWIGDGTPISNGKVERAFRALTIREEQGADPLINRLALIHCQFSNKTGQVSDCGIKVLGGIPRFSNASTRQIMEQTAAMTVFAPLV